jgi:hypothetical protein
VQRFLLGRPLGVDYRLERLVVDADARRRQPGLLWIFSRDECDRFAEVADTIEGEHRLILKLART